MVVYKDSQKSLARIKHDLGLAVFRLLVEEKTYKQGISAIHKHMQAHTTTRIYRETEIFFYKILHAYDGGRR